MMKLLFAGCVAWALCAPAYAQNYYNNQAEENWQRQQELQQQQNWQRQQQQEWMEQQRERQQRDISRGQLW